MAAAGSAGNTRVFSEVRRVAGQVIRGILRVSEDGGPATSRNRNRASNSSRRDFLKTAAGVAAGAPLPNPSGGPRRTRHPSVSQHRSEVHDHPRSGVGVECVQGPGRSDLRRQRRLEALHRLPDLEDAGVRRRRSRSPSTSRTTTTSSTTGRIGGRTCTTPANAVEKLVTDGTPVPVVASYGMTSGFTPPEGITAQMLYYDPAHPPAESEIAGKILVFQTAQQPAPPYTNNFLDNYTLTDYEWRSPGKWPPLFTPPPRSVDDVVSRPLGVESVEPLRRRSASRGTRRASSSSTTCRRAWRSASRSGACTRRERTRGTRRDLHQLSDADARSRERREGAGRREGRQDGDAHADARASSATRARRSSRICRARTTARRRTSRCCSPRTPTRCRSSRRTAASACSASCRTSIGCRRAQRARTLVFYFDCRHFMPGGEAQLAAVRLLHDSSGAAEDDRRHARHGAHGRAPDDRDGPGGNTYALLDRAPGRRRRHHQPDGRPQQQHLAGRRRSRARRPTITGRAWT